MKKLMDKANGPALRDPYIIKHNNKYYRCFTEDWLSVSISCADTIEGLSEAVGKKVFVPEENKPYSKEVWAPELHVIDGKCYIYVACDDGSNPNHRMYVLVNNSNDPLDTYVMHGKITDPTDKWAIDGNVIQYQGKLYFIWSGWEGDVNGCQNLYIAGMKNPYEIETERVLISTPEYEWEKLGSAVGGRPFINEGPFGFVVDGQLYVTYSAAGSWCKDYCIAVLRLNGDDPLDANAWVKGEKPILSCNDMVKGAGHCSVVCEDETLHVFFHGWDINEEKIVWRTVSLWHGNMMIKDENITIA